MTDQPSAAAMVATECWECGSCGCTDAEVVGDDLFAYHWPTCPEYLGAVSDMGDVELIGQRMAERGYVLAEYSVGPWLIHWRTGALP